MKTKVETLCHSEKMIQEAWKLDLGANLREDGSTSFKIWAPYQSTLSLKIGSGSSYSLLPMEKGKEGYFTCETDRIGEKDHYFYRLSNGLERPDPVSRCLPISVHGPTAVVNPQFTWTDQDWKGLNLEELVFYELHVGTFSRAGNFEGIIDKLPYLKDLGVNCLELMPIAQFPGRWNWGYDGVSPFAVERTYGGVHAFKELVNACHENKIAVCLDVVYNHLGPEGNYLEEFGPYFSQTYHTPWGRAFNYDGAYSDHVRHYIIQNALYWLAEYHVDLLRLDAIHGMFDFSATKLLFELKKRVSSLGTELGKKIYLIAESALNDSKVVSAAEDGGLNLDAMWNDDYHHAAHVALTHETKGYYQDYKGLECVAKALKDRFVYDWKYSPFRKKHYGNSAKDIPYQRFIAFMQNHDQIGNRPLGDRLASMMNFSRLKVAAILTLSTPFLPLLFMGQEYGEKGSFEFFVDYEEEKLMRAVFEGRKREFHREDMPFPGKEAYLRSHLSWDLEESLHKLYKDLIAYRKKYPPSLNLLEDQVNVYYNIDAHWIGWEYKTRAKKWFQVLCHLNTEPMELKYPFKKRSSVNLLMSTDDKIYRGGVKMHYQSETQEVSLPVESAAIFLAEEMKD